VSEGEAFGFVGANGAGKSTTIKMLMGLVRPTNGTLTIQGIDCRRPEARYGVGYVPESPYLYDFLSPREILEMSCALHRVPASLRKARIDQWLGRFGIDHVADKPLRKFSKGMMQRTALAQAMCMAPRLLVLDEPLSGLDPLGRREVVDILVEYHRQGGTILFSSHVLFDVERLADRFGLIHKGELRTVRSPAELVNEAHPLIIRSEGESALDFLQADGQKRWYGEIRREALWSALDALRAAGHQIIEVKPKLSLEDAFMEYVRESQTSN
jgi:ABC-2 type transport system ATP-binding protein